MKLIKKYKITNNDLHQIFSIEQKKKTSKFLERERLKSETLKILKPYKISFLDLGNLINEISILNFDSNQVLMNNIESNELEVKSSTPSKNSPPKKLNKFITLIIILPIMFYVGYLLFQPNKIDEINHKYSGQYKGVVPVSSNSDYTVNGEYEFSVWEFKLKDGKYRARAEGRVFTETKALVLRGEMTIDESQFENLTEDTKSTIKICLRDDNGTSFFVGNPCELNHTFNEPGFENGAIITPNNHLVPRVTLYENWKHVPVE